MQSPLFDANVSVNDSSDGLSRGDFWPSRNLNFVDLFCGIGGFHFASRGLGLDCVLACDIDAEARKSYHANFGIQPTVDVRKLDPVLMPDFDLLFAGFPCQPFSIIGSQEGFADSRGTLFFEIERILAAKRPLGFVLENVRQLVAHDQGRTLNHILTSLSGLGYHVEYRVLNALNFGLPQKRERVLIVGFSERVDGFEWPSAAVPMTPLHEVLEREVAPRYYVSPRIRAQRHEKHKSSVRPAIWHENKSGNVSSHPFSCALRAGASYNYLLVDGERRLTGREMLRLQGFPEEFTIVCNESQMRKQAGNAVPVPMIREVIRRVLSVRRP